MSGDQELSAPTLDAEVVTCHLNDRDRGMCREVVIRGPRYLTTIAKLTRSEAKRFLDRVDVQQELDFLRAQYDDREGIQARTQFYAMLRLNDMVPAALIILAKALAGTRRDASGVPVEPPPEKIQYEAAIQVLERVNVQGQKLAPGSSIDARSFHLHTHGAEDPQQPERAVLNAEGRRRVRDMVKKLRLNVGGLVEADRAARARGRDTGGRFRPRPAPAAPVADEEDLGEARVDPNAPDERDA